VVTHAGRFGRSHDYDLSDLQVCATFPHQGSHSYAIVFGDVLRRACIDHPILGTANNKTILPQIVGSSAKHVNRWDFSEHDQPRRAVYHREFWDDS